MCVCDVVCLCDGLQAKLAVMAAQSSGELWAAAAVLGSVSCSAGGGWGVVGVGGLGGWGWGGGGGRGGGGGG